MRVLFVIGYLALSFLGISRNSATWDEPQQLAAGYALLAHQDYRLDPEHLPLIRMWAAIPLLAVQDVSIDTESKDWMRGDVFSIGHRFLYESNHADTILLPARLMISLLGVLLGLVLYCWANAIFGSLPSAAVLALYALEPNLLAHSGLVTTDFGVTLGIFATIFLLWCLCQQITWVRLFYFVAVFSLTMLSKFTSLILIPLTAILLVGHSLNRTSWSSNILGFLEFQSPLKKLVVSIAVFCAVAVASYATIWAVYGFRYGPQPEQPSKAWHEVSAMEQARELKPALSAVVAWIDQHKLLPNSYMQGFLLSRSKSTRRSAYLAGEISATGWWYYFPAAFLLKTPLSVLLLFFTGMFFSLRTWRSEGSTYAFILLPIGAMFVAAMTSNLNIGIRHILPVFPFVLLFCGISLSKLAKKNKLYVWILPLFALLEFGWVCPNYLTFFNAAVGGPSNGHRYLLDSNLDWGQDLKELSYWMSENQVHHINLSYFGTADPAYYSIDCNHLPGAPFYLRSKVQGPTLPGYVAVSATNLHGVYFKGESREFYKPLLEQKPVAVIGNTIFVYYVERPWWVDISADSIDN